MRKTILAAGASFAFHTLAVLWLHPYNELVFNAGLLLIPSHHIEDIPQVILAGFLAIGAVAVAIGVIIERSWKYVQEG
jgi:hypothetical protein